MKQNLKRIIILCSVILCSVQGKSQTYVKSFPQYIDKYVTDKIIDSLKTRQISDFIIFQTNVDNKVVIDTSLIKNDTITVSYLIWKEKGRIKSFILTDSCVYGNVSDMEDNAKIFNYPNFSQLWVRVDEAGGESDKNKFYYVPHYNEPYNKDIIVFITQNYKRFFEFGRDTYYQLKPSRNKYRKEYISMLNSVVSQFNCKWEKAFRNEKRWWGEDNL